jgi:NADPH2:quinone reductase
MNEIAMRAARTGGPEVIERVSIELTPPKPGEVRIRHHAIGVNFIDAYFRSGLYPTPLPTGLGSEAAGVVEAVGPDVVLVAVGDRVAYATGPLGAYSTARNIAANLLVPLPDSIDFDIAAAAMLKGMTAAMLAGPCARVERGQHALVHAAAGGVGLILVQWLARLGVEVIAHAGTEAKAAQAKAAGASTALSCPLDELAAAVRDATGARGVDVVFDGVGAASWAASLASVAKRGMLVVFGNASGPVPPVDPLALMRAGSIFLTRPSLFDYAAASADRAKLAGALFDMIGTELKIEIGQRFPLADAAEAHRRLEARQTVGSTVLTI